MLGRVAIWVLVAVVLFTVFKQFDNRTDVAVDTTSYTQFMDDAKAGKIKRVDIQGRKIFVKPNSGSEYQITSPGDLWMVDDLRKDGVAVYGKAEEEPSVWTTIFVSWFPMLLLIGVWIFFMRQMQGGGKGGAFNGSFISCCCFSCGASPISNSCIFHSAGRTSELSKDPGTPPGPFG